ncbi:MAG: signal peptidase I [Thermoflexales bacterium]
MNETAPIPDAAEPAALPAQSKGSAGRAVLREIAETVALFVVVFIVARFAIGNYSILGQSMEPNYHEDQRLLVDKISPHLFGYNRGDVVIVHSPIQDIELIKRLIGKPGDVIELRDNRVYVNNEPLDEPYLPPGAYSGPMHGSARWALGPDEYFIMGDNRSFSQDSRAFGPVTADKIVGRALLLYWPLSDLHIVQHYRYK